MEDEKEDKEDLEIQLKFLKEHEKKLLKLIEISEPKIIDIIGIDELLEDPETIDPATKDILEHERNKLIAELDSDELDKEIELKEKEHIKDLINNRIKQLKIMYKIQDLEGE